MPSSKPARRPPASPSSTSTTPWAVGAPTSPRSSAVAREGSRGAPIVALIAPEPDNYTVLKPKHSGFFATPLDALLQYLGAGRLILTGASSHQCVLFTANDAYVRDLERLIPRDRISARSVAETRLALRYFTNVLGADTKRSTALRFRAKKIRRPMR